MSKNTKLKIIEYFWANYRWQSFFMMLVQCLTGLLEGLGIAALLPLIEVFINDSATVSSPLNDFVQKIFSFLNIVPTLENILVVILGLFFAKAALKYLAALFVSNVTAQIILDFRAKFVNGLLGSKWSFYTKNPIGFFVNALIAEAQRSGAAYGSLMSIFSSLLQIIALLCIAALASMEVVIVSLVSAIILWLTLHSFIKAAGEIGAAQKNIFRKTTAKITDILQNYKPLKTMHAERKVFEHINYAITQLSTLTRKQLMAKQGMNIFHEPIFVTIISVCLYGAVTFLEMGAAILMVLAAVFYRFISAWRLLQQGYQSLAGQESFFWSLQNLTEDAYAEKEAHMTGKMPTLKNYIHLKNINFSYQDKEILKNLDLRIKANTFTGLCGPSGTGKTTILDLICRLHNPLSGQVLIDNMALEKIDLYKWRDQIGYVPQEFVVFNETIFQNITMGDPNIKRLDVIEALKQAEAWGFVEEFPDGLDTKLGAAGNSLSGGQRQRISIARALARKPGLLILDEATASLDSKTEQKIFKTLKNLAKEMTIIAVSHQQNMIDYADVVIDLGAMQNHA